MTNTKLDDNTYDVIIAGAGPAGCALASRLSEQSDKHVLLLEAGPDAAAPGTEHPDVLDPFCQMASDNPALQWPDIGVELYAERRDGLKSAMRPYPQGYSVGGGSNINGMGVERGQPGDYDEWRDLGAEGWGWNEVLHYFKKAEHDLDFPSVSSLHGSQGPMPVRRLPRSLWAPFAAAIGDALQRRGYPFIEDYTGDDRDGFAAATTNCLPQRRVSAAMAYLTREVRSRPNLKVVPHARVERLSLEGKRANGVFVREHGARRLVLGRQVIISCGAIQSPALLMRSGIGPREQLSKHNIPVLQDLPGVGANLQNHPYVVLTTFLPREAAQPMDNVWFLQNWLRYSSGHPGCDAHDMHLMAFNKCAWHSLGHRVGAVTVSVFKSYSKGSVELSSSDPEASPKVQMNMFGDSRDEERLTSGVRFVLELLMDPAVAKMRRELFFPDHGLVASLSQRNTRNRIKAATIASILDRALLRRVLLASSRLDAHRLLADEQSLRDFVRQHAQVQFHVCGTCRMGHTGDAGAVVDNAGRVRGVEALRVVDASIFPTIPRSNVHFPVLMTAEKMADAIKADWNITR